MADIELTELTDIDVVRQDGVRSPASGRAFLIMKSTAASTTNAAVPPVTEETAPVPEATEPATKSAPEGAAQTSAATPPQADAALSRTDIEKMIEDRVEAVTKDAEGRVKALADELAVLKATPIPAGVALTATASVREDKAKDEAVTKAAYYDRMADTVTDRELAKYYRAKADEVRAQAR